MGAQVGTPLELIFLSKPLKYRVGVQVGVWVGVALKDWVVIILCHRPICPALIVRS